MWFLIVVIVIICCAIYIAKKSSEAKRQRLHKEIASIKKAYPHAFAEYILKNHVSIGSAKNSVLEEITTRPSHIWKNEEQSLIEKEKRIIQQYNEIAKEYPNGLARWNRLNPKSSREIIVINKDKIANYETLERIEIANKQREEEERRKRQEEETKRKRELEEARRKAELAKYKSDKDAIIKVLQNNGIQCFYHFTARENLSSIRQLGGLFSWYSMEQRGKGIPCPGGGNLSRQLDQSRGLEDYVRLSFTKNHPMMYVARNEGRIVNPVVLKISIDVATLKGTKYSNKNATIRREPVNIGETISDLRQIHFQTVRQINHFNLDDEEKSFYQAEVLVKTFIPIDYIMNLDNPIIP